MSLPLTVIGRTKKVLVGTFERSNTGVPVAAKENIRKESDRIDGAVDREFNLTSKY